MFFHVIFYDLHDRIHYLVNFPTVSGYVFLSFKLIVYHAKYDIGMQDIILQPAKPYFVPQAAFGIKIIHAGAWNVRVLDRKNI